jgi:hypothetical protein
MAYTSVAGMDSAIQMCWGKGSGLPMPACNACNAWDTLVRTCQYCLTKAGKRALLDDPSVADTVGLCSRALEGYERVAVMGKGIKV